MLPKLLPVELVVVGDRSGEATGFLTLQRSEVVVVRGAAQSARFRYDIVTRRALDAAIVVAHFVEDGTLHVYLRSAIRPPVALRSPPWPGGGVLWEVAAGLIEPGEAPAEGAARELEEELGFRLPASAMVPLGPTVFPAPAFIAEAHYFFHARVDPGLLAEPSGDGSPIEQGAQIVAVPLSTALAACRAGLVTDAKSELALRRLAELGPLAPAPAAEPSSASEAAP